MANPPKLTRNESLFLDAVRGAASQIVVIGHGISFFSIAKILHEPNVPWMQNIAVVIFFILSGFVINYSVVNKILIDKSYTFRGFFIDRFTRIYPVFVTALLFVFLVDFFSLKWGGQESYENAFNFSTITANFFMLQDYPLARLIGFQCTSFGSGRPFWTLAIEWWIYMFYGFLVLKLMLENKCPDLINFIILGFLIIVPLYNAIDGRGNGLTLYWIFGMIVCFIYPKYKLFITHKHILIKVLLFIAICVIICLRFLVNGMKAYDPIVAFFLAFLMLVSLELSTKIKIKHLLGKIVRFNASYAFTLYLVHYSILDFLSTHFKASQNPYFLFILGFFLSNIAAIIIGRFIELKVSKKLRFYFKKRIKSPDYLQKVNYL
jgi:peptidoglycan/LPS O-acetylase OafA/YrhL